MRESERLRPGDYLTIAQVQEILPVGRSSIYALCESGQLQHHRVRALGSRRGRILVARADLAAYLDSTRHAATRAPVRLDVDGLLEKVRKGGRT